MMPLGLWATGEKTAEVRYLSHHVSHLPSQVAVTLTIWSRWCFPVSSVFFLPMLSYLWGVGSREWGGSSLSPTSRTGRYSLTLFGFFSDEGFSCSLINHLCKERISQIPLKFPSSSKMGHNKLEGQKINTRHSNLIQVLLIVVSPKVLRQHAQYHLSSFSEPSDNRLGPGIRGPAGW